MLPSAKVGSTVSSIGTNGSPPWSSCLQKSLRACAEVAPVPVGVTLVTVGVYVAVTRNLLVLIDSFNRYWSWSTNILFSV